MMGWENAFHCEINPFGRAVLDYWFPESISYEDITKSSFKEWRGRVDVLTGGFPCQRRHATMPPTNLSRSVSRSGTIQS